MPDGADAVVMVEETERVDGTRRIRVFTPVYPRQNVGRRGADIAPARPSLQPGDLLIPGRVGALAAIGAADVDVFARPEVAILSTGNEIVAPGRPLEPGQIYDINRYTLSSIVAAHGGVPVALPDRTRHARGVDRRRSIGPCRTTWSSFPAAAPSASAI